MDDSLEKLVRSVLSSSKYRNINPEFIAQIGAQELKKRRDWKEALKATKNKLHQVAGAYLETTLPYPKWLAHLREVDVMADPTTLRDQCRQMLAHHASTRERLPILETFYHLTLGELAPVHSVLDLACGLNPLTIPWMPLAPEAQYYACDIYTDLVAFANQVLQILGVKGEVRICDLTQGIPRQRVQLALVLKSLPCLEQVDKTVTQHLLDGVQADHLLVSFPAHSLGGYSKGMTENYAARFEEVLTERSWQYQKYEFSTELAFLVHKDLDGASNHLIGSIEGK